MKDLQVLFTDIKVTHRQTDCINPLLDGATIKEIAAKLKISPRTVETHIDSPKTKFNASTIIKAKQFLQRNG